MTAPALRKHYLPAFASDGGARSLAPFAKRRPFAFVGLCHRFSTALLTERMPAIRSDLFLEIFRVFREKNIEMPFPQRDLHTRSVEAPFALPQPGQTAS
jgi:small-conductance mechanosensitive channel